MAVKEITSTGSGKLFVAESTLTACPDEGLIYSARAVTASVGSPRYSNQAFLAHG
jgi:hypothetical protein